MIWCDFSSAYALKTPDAPQASGQSTRNHLFECSPRKSWYMGGVTYTHASYVRLQIHVCVRYTYIYTYMYIYIYIYICIYIYIRIIYHIRMRTYVVEVRDGLLVMVLVCVGETCPRVADADGKPHHVPTHACSQTAFLFLGPFLTWEFPKSGAQSMDLKQ